VARIAILTVSDGRRNVHEDIAAFCADVQERLAHALRTAGDDVVVAEEIVWTSELATLEARRLDAARPDLTIVNIPVWAFPHFTAIVGRTISGPLVLFANLDPQYPGMVGMLAAAGALDQIGRRHGRVCGDLDDPAVRAQLGLHARAGASVRALEGTTFGRIGGRPMGMYTAVSNTDEWMKLFAVDVEEIDEWELVRRSETVPKKEVTAARAWLERVSGGVHYDGSKLTPESLERQLRSYFAMRELIRDWKLAFSGIKGQPELTDHYATMDVTEAFLNDPYDWDGPKETHVCATEADMDGALTMQILKGLSGTPVLFADVRHYHADRNIWDLCNSGQHATWFAARSDHAEENLAHVHFYPEVFYFPAGGASVHHLAAPGEMTFARLTRRDSRYRLHVLRGRFEQFDQETNERLMRASTYEWPHAFASLDASSSDILARYSSNHIHAVPGDYVDELKLVCELLDVEFDGFGSAGA
jgi:L-fucose isomerase